MMKKVFPLIFPLLVAPSWAEDAPKDKSMDGELGLIVTTGNTETESFKLALAGSQELTDWSNEYKFEALYKKDEVSQDDGSEQSQTTAQKYFASAQGNYKLDNPDHRLFMFASYEDDRFSSFDYQATIAAGWNQQLWQNETSRFNYSIGPGYALNKTQQGEDEDSFILRGSLGYEWTISDNAKFSQSFSTEVGEDNTKSKSETAISANINGALAMKFSIKLDHNSEVADNRDNLDTETAVTLVYSFF